MNATSQKSEKITVYSSLTQDQILINFYYTGITAYTSRKIKTKLTILQMIDLKMKGFIVSSQKSPVMLDVSN